MEGYTIWLIVLFGGLNSVSSDLKCCEESGCKVNNQQTSCKSGRNLFNNICLKTCPSGYYGIDGKCERCAKTCATCEQTHCTSCHDLFLTKEGLCLGNCPGKTLGKSSASRWTRLVHGRTKFEGHIEVYYDGSWGTICADSWDVNAAKVICNELQLGTVAEPMIVNQMRFNSADNKEMKIWLNGVQCSGNEKTIFDCRHNDWGNNECSHLEDVGIRCFGPDSSKSCVTSCGDGYREYKGACLECPIDCKTCNASGDCLECVDLRYLEGTKCVSVCQPGSYGKLGSKHCVACPLGCSACYEWPKSKVNCQGCEARWFLNGDKCVTKCTGPLSLPYVRLSGNFATRYEGLLEIRYQDEWMTVCDDDFDIFDARVICRELGYGEPLTFASTLYGTGSRSILARNLQCKGNEKRFIDCDQDDWPARGCSHIEDIGLACAPPATGIGATGRCVKDCDQGTYLLSKNSCELCNRACEVCAGSAERCTKCREPYYLNGTKCLLVCKNGLYSDTPHRRCLPCNAECSSCRGKADNCLTCHSSFLLSGSKCVKSCPEKRFRKGFKCVEDCGLHHYGENVARVCHSCPVNCLACYKLQSQNLTCQLCAVGFVLDLHGKCMTTCPPGYVIAPAKLAAIGVRPRLRLLNTGSSKYTGRLEIYYNGTWGSVCDDGWHSPSSKVACRELLLGPPAGPAYSNPKSFKEMNISRIWLDDLSCSGNEESIADCPHSGWGAQNCDHVEDVHLICSSPGVSSCQKECPIGYFLATNTCQPCDIGCDDCYGRADNCTTCVGKFHKSVNSSCILNCPIGYYAKERHCLRCSKTCLTCSVVHDNCTSCRPPAMVFKTWCLNKCPTNWYPRGPSIISLVHKTGPYTGLVQVTVNGKRGFACDWMSTRQDAIVICRQLNMGEPVKKYVANVKNQSLPLLLKNPVCIGNESSYTDCVTNPQFAYCFYNSIVGVECSGPDVSSACIPCNLNNGYFIADDGSCSRCSRNCLKCSRTSTNCTACKKGYMRNGTNCISLCLEGTYYLDKACYPCVSTCTACEIEEYCTSCAAGRYLAGQSCNKVCKKGVLKQSGVSGIRLSEGKEGRVEILANQTWSTICAEGWDMASGMVVCRQLGFGDALQAHGIHVYNYDDSYNVLKPFICNGNEKDLWHCERGALCLTNSMLATVKCSRFSLKKQCVTSCGLGFYRVPGQDECKTCLTSCLTCSGSADHCTSCNDTAFMDNFKCAQECPKGYYGNMGSRKCEQCAPKCKTCLDGWTNNRCTSCKSRYYLKNMGCVDDCYPWHSLDGLIALTKVPLVVKLKYGNRSNEGFLQLYHNGEWRHVCSLRYSYADLVCRNLGYRYGNALLKDSSKYFTDSSTKWAVVCKEYTRDISECEFKLFPRCSPDSAIFMRCAEESIDYRVCRKIIPRTCRNHACARFKSCVDGDGSVVPRDNSFCVDCAPGFYGDGDNCTEIAKRPWSVIGTMINITAEYKSTLRILCNAYSGVQLKYASRYSWTKHGVQLRIVSSLFVMYDVHYSDTGLYVCTLRNSLGSWSVTYNITVVGRPIIISAPNIDATQHSNAMLNCRAMGFPIPRITWYRGQKRVVTSSEFKVLENGSLEIIESTKGHGGNYTCNARNRFGYEKVDVLLRVPEEEGFKEKAQEQRIRKGDTAKFGCKPLQNNAKITWRRNGVSLKTDSRVIITEQGDLILKNVSQSDCGQYYCVIKNDKYIATSVGTLILLDEPPCIYHAPKNLDLQAGMNARFYCRACGHPPPVIHWKHRKIQIFPNAYEVKNASIKDVGVYVCFAQSGHLSSEEYAFLSVDQQYACPYISRRPNSISRAVQGTPQSFYCDGSAVPSFNITWYFNNDNEIKPDKKYILSNQNRKLTINDVRSDDTGKYLCVVRSPFGQQNAEASLTVVSEPVRPSATKSSSKTGVVVGILVPFFILAIVIYFVWRYRRDGVSPTDVLSDVKRKTVACFTRENRPVALQYDSDHLSHDEEYDVDMSDTNPFVRD